MHVITTFIGGFMLGMGGMALLIGATFFPHCVFVVITVVGAVLLVAGLALARMEAVGPAGRTPGCRGGIGSGTGGGATGPHVGAFPPLGARRGAAVQ